MAASYLAERFCIRRRFVPHLLALKAMTTGACINNGSTDRTPRGGCSFIFNHSSYGTMSFALETKGPDDHIHIHTNNRVELRAIISALSFRSWWSKAGTASSSQRTRNASARTQGNGCTPGLLKAGMNALANEAAKSATGRADGNEEYPGSIGVLI
ncbi:hypothetical protein HD806DRAFT_538607 [Xylariaceae sp. AK1471]|nr:hypothetical protein HD806DRAFT_538607 [Xylariaceae sp. AK1471]